MSITKAFGISISLALALFIGSADYVAAHTLKVDGTIGVTMHIDPDDTPIANQNAHIMIGVQDRSGAFTGFNACQCSVAIKQADSVLATVPLTAASTTDMANFTFTSAGAYTLTVSGTPTQGAQFNPFTVDFTYTIGRARNSTAFQSEDNALRRFMPFAIIGGTAVVMLLFFIPVNRIRQ